MAAELGAVIIRPKFSRLGTEKERVHNIQTLLSAPHIMAIVPTFTILHPDLLDVDDNRLLEVAIASDAALIVAGDNELLALGAINGPHAIDHFIASNHDSSIAPKILIMSPVDSLDYLQSS